MNDFEINQKLGEGAYSIVYKTRRLVDGNIYALKKVKLLNLSDKEKMNALNEVRILASLKSNYVISYKEAFFDENESCLGIVMEFADKGDLYQKITEFKKAGVYFEESDIWRVFIQLVKGLKALHDLKILHRDLKSANVFLFNDGSAKLGDLNVSKVARRGLGYTQTGTPYYASPEVWRDQPYDLKSDMWSLGCVLYEMITLKPPFRAENMEGLFKKVCKGQFSRIPERFSTDLSEILKMLLQVQPETRPNCDQLLKNSILVRRMDAVKHATFHEEPDPENNILLQTIKIPKNLLVLTDKLPQANYDKNRYKKVKKQQLETVSGLKKNLTEANEIKPPKKIIVTDTLEESKDQNLSPKKKPTKEVIINAEEKKTNKLPSGSNTNAAASPNRPQSKIINTEEIEKKKDASVLPSIKVHSNQAASPIRKEVKNNYSPLKIHNQGIHGSKKELHLEVKNSKPYINNEHLANIYKIYNPSYLKYDKNKYNNEKLIYIKKLEKYNDYHNLYNKPKKLINEISKQRRLSPIGKKPYM